MKQLYCPKCGMTYQQGNFCVKDGSQLLTQVTADIQFKPIESQRTSDQLKRDAKNWLSRIGVTDILFESANESASIQYTLGSKRYSFKSHMQNNITNNLAAIEQFLHYRVLGIERGIETSEQAFAGYAALENKSSDFFAGCINSNEIEKRYRELAKELHPDVNNGHNESFVELQKQHDKAKLKYT